MILFESLLLFTIVTGLTTVFGQNVEKCEKEKNCSIKINQTTAYHCVVGHQAACDRISSTGEPPPPGSPSVYPYLSTIGIYKRAVMTTYGESLRPSFNFSFRLPRTSFGVGGSALGVMAQFQEAPGYRNNTHYEIPICRLFNMSGSDFMDPDMITTGKLTIPYNCIGIGITHSVFRLRLTTIPTNHALDYVISWEHRQVTYHDYFFNADTSQMWEEPMVAVATLSDERCIHVVFVSPANDDVMVNVSLQNRHGVVQSKLLENGENEAMFTGVTGGNYWVALEPIGDECEYEPITCPVIRSAEIWTNGSVQDDGSDVFATVALASCVAIASVLVVLIIVIATWLLQRHSNLRKTQNPSSILVISQASRDLEVRLTSYFCVFLGELFQTEVDYECPAIDSGDTVNLMTTNDNSRSSLLRRGESDGGNYLCAIHLLFSYSAPVNDEPSTSVCLLNQNSNSPGQRSYWDEIVFKEKSQSSPKTSSKIACKTKTKTSSGFNSVVALFTNDRATRKSIGPFADALTNDEQITVMAERFCHSSLSQHDAQSMYNRPDLWPVTTDGHYANVYHLPWQMMDLCTELCRTLPKYKTICLDDEGVLSSSLWVVIRGLHDKASENQPSDGGVDAWIQEIPDPAINSTWTLCSSLLEPVAPLGINVPQLSECDETMASDEGSFSNLSEAARQLGGSQRDRGSFRSFECPASAGIRPSCPHVFQLHGDESVTGSCPDLIAPAAFSQPVNGEHSPASHIPDGFKAQIVPPTL